MKNKYLILTTILLIAGSLLTGCDDNRDRTAEEDAENIEQAKQDLENSEAQYEMEWQQFNNDSESKISANDKRINEFKKKLVTASENFKAKFENKILTLEQKNIELKKKLNEYEYEGEDNWKNFKQEFNDDVDSIANAITNVFTEKD